ncbi:Por secretion system C-terminal sorting domain-containing protein [Mesonia phycicola]|uniref:Por secretion system C-terminal sorting domain-containing protein n=1 Tax=Mesonia phycicola TaxID=579105 RepID=A0A1M6C3V8_9FLAO|nr:choice-of-anchor I family protein [Mesonia phycicola]SHI55632.1 Por secretion system C-terminal sorting domain-containing protein [Mesonia phycicola]
MKKIYLSALLALISCVSFAQEALITGYVDSPCSGANGRAVEIYVNGTIDFTGWNLVRQANGGGYTTNVDLSSFGSITDSFVYITNDQAIFQAEFGTQSNIIENSTISSNGDDAFQIIDANSTVIDRFGEDGVDGTGTAWEHLDTYYLRNNGETANGGNFDATNWTFGALNALDNQGLCNTAAQLNTLVALGSFVAAAPLPEIYFDEEYVSVNENGGSVTLTVEISELPTTDATVDVTILTAESTAVSGQNYTYTGETLTFTTTGSTSQTITITIPDNSDVEPDTMLALELSNATNATLDSDIVSVVYILDDEMHAPTATQNLGITFGASYAIGGSNPGSEIVAHDPNTQRLFVMNSGNASVEILDFSNPLNISAISTIDLSTYGDSSTSVAHYNGLVAATAVPDLVGQDGKVVFMDTDGVIISSVDVGSLPDMITFSPDGTMLLVANEGQPNNDYSVDPEGTISVIDLTGGAASLTQADVTTLNFNAFDTQLAQLEADGIRIFGPNASVSQDLEPEYIAVSDDSQTAWVTLQENNAIAVVDLVNLQITDIWSLGYKDHSLAENALDASNDQDFIFMANWPIKGMYMPDAIASYTVNGTTYYVTANEGDAREYDTFEEEVDLEDLLLDASVFPNQEYLQLDGNLGKLTFTDTHGDIDNDGEYEELYVYGGRSFSIYDASTGTQVYDSGSDFERIIEEDPVYNAIFNATDDENELKNRSDNKGPEPEAVIVQEIDGVYYAFIALERVGGFMVYNITNPVAPVFEGYYNNRSVTPGEDDIANLGDLAPESIVYVAPEDNSEAKGLIVIANEVSATISVYTLNNDVLSTSNYESEKNSFVIYPNPAKSERVFFNQPTDYVLFDMQGRKVKAANQATYINVANLTTGTYLVKNTNGQVQKLVIN